MDALIVFSAIVFVLCSLSALAVTWGVDSRDGFADDRPRPTIA